MRQNKEEEVKEQQLLKPLIQDDELTLSIKFHNIDIIYFYNTFLCSSDQCLSMFKSTFLLKNKKYVGKFS